MHGITVQMLLRSHRKIQRLERKWFPTPAGLQHRLDLRQQSQLFHRCALLPSILNTQTTNTALLAPGLQVKAGLEITANARGQGLHPLTPQIQHGITPLIQLLSKITKRTEQALLQMIGEHRESISGMPFSGVVFSERAGCRQAAPVFRPAIAKSRHRASIPRQFIDAQPLLPTQNTDPPFEGMGQGSVGLLCLRFKIVEFERQRHKGSSTDTRPANMLPAAKSAPARSSPAGRCASAAP